MMSVKITIVRGMVGITEKPKSSFVKQIPNLYAASLADSELISAWLLGAS
jgi:hypothetical protein